MWADSRCAVSGTGWGEFFIRAAVAHDICARVAYRGDTVAAAAEDVVMKVVPALGGDGGVIALDAKGNFAMPFSTQGMYRGTIDADGDDRDLQGLTRRAVRRIPIRWPPARRTDEIPAGGASAPMLSPHEIRRPNVA